jgi:hypothetical protein
MLSALAILDDPSTGGGNLHRALSSCLWHWRVDMEETEASSSAVSFALALGLG